METIRAVYNVKSVGPPEYYLGNNFKKDKKGYWMIGCNKCIVEAVSHVERIFGKLTKHDTPMVAGDHPKLDDLAILDDKEHQKYQMWIACPRMGYQEWALYIFGSAGGGSTFQAAGAISRSKGITR
eukprot:557772-Ditylum_brightwellii.AAC.1